MSYDIPAEWAAKTHSSELTCAKGFILRRRDWAEHGAAGCFTNNCPNAECEIPARKIGRGKVENG